MEKNNLIEISDKRICSGCGACLNSCPRQCINFKLDEEGFIYPVIEKEKCIDCHLCEKVCPWRRKEFIERKIEKNNIFYSAQLYNKKTLSMVSSGGVSWAVAKKVINKEGSVYGAAQFGVDRIKHIRALTLSDIELIRRSKYLQSDIGRSYTLAKEDLNSGRQVLFTGTGCQIAGLLSFIGKNYDNLLTIDVVCHGVPSLKVWRRYRLETEKKTNSSMEKLVFRDKSAGWKNNQYLQVYKNGKYEKQLSIDHPFHQGYLMGMYSRPSCGNCQFNLLPRLSDITLADYWEYDGELFKDTQELGISLVCCNTEKGYDFIQSLEEDVALEPTTEKKALASCKYLNNIPKENVNRDFFLSDLEKHGFYHAWRKYIKKRKSCLFAVKKLLKGIKL